MRASGRSHARANASWRPRRVGSDWPQRRASERRVLGQYSGQFGVVTQASREGIGPNFQRELPSTRMHSSFLRPQRDSKSIPAISQKPSGTRPWPVSPRIFDERGCLLEPSRVDSGRLALQSHGTLTALRLFHWGHPDLSPWTDLLGMFVGARIRSRRSISAAHAVQETAHL